MIQSKAEFRSFLLKRFILTYAKINKKFSFTMSYNYCKDCKIIKANL